MVDILKSSQMSTLNVRPLSNVWKTALIIFVFRVGAFFSYSYLILLVQARYSGAILGACFGPVAFLWITLGGIFFGAMHDFLSGMMIMRHDGRSLPEIIGIYLGVSTRAVVMVFSIILMVLVGAVFILSPAALLSSMVPAVGKNIWVWIILVYYILATMLPVDKVIGKVYPIFGIALVAMAVGLLEY